MNLNFLFCNKSWVLWYVTPLCNFIIFRQCFIKLREKITMDLRCYIPGSLKMLVVHVSSRITKIFIPTYLYSKEIIGMWGWDAIFSYCFHLVFVVLAHLPMCRKHHLVLVTNKRMIVDIVKQFNIPSIWTKIKMNLNFGFTTIIASSFMLSFPRYQIYELFISMTKKRLLDYYTFVIPNNTILSTSKFM